MRMKAKKKFVPHPHTSDLGLGNIVSVENSAGFYRIVKVYQHGYEVEEVDSPYMLLFYIAAMKLKFYIKKIYHKISFHQ